MNAIQAGVEKVKEAVHSKKADEKAEKAHDPTVKPSERVDAAFEAGKSAMKAQEHACKAECHKDKHISNINIMILVNSFILKFETNCTSFEFFDLENLIGSLHRYAPKYGYLFVRDMGLTIGQRKLLKRYENIEIISSNFKQKEKHIEIINVKHEFIRLNKTLLNRHNNNQYNYIDLIRKQFYLAIIIPFIDNQLNNLINQLNSHTIYIPCQNQSNSIDLIFYYNKKNSSLLKNFFYLNKCFKNIHFLSADLSKQEDKYPIGSAIMWKKLFINEQFNNISLRYHGYTHFFLMEPDTRPIRSYWLDAIVEQITNSYNRDSYISTQWWMIGSIYRGSKSIGKHFLHINGNALYHLSINFIRFLEYVSDEYPFNSQRSLGYDLDIFLYLLKNIDKGKKFWHKFHFSDFIQNCWHTSCNETNIEFLYNNPNTYLIHGKMFNFMNNSTIIQMEFWFLPIDILMIITNALTIILGLIFLFIVITHKICWSVSMMLICNSCLAEVLLSCVILNMSIFTFQHDLKQNTGNGSLCINLGFLCYITVMCQNYSYLLTAIYRYISVVYPTKILWQSVKFQICLILIKWSFCVIFALPLLLTGQIIYNIDNQICQLPLNLSVNMIYVSFILYFIPNSGILYVYIKLTRYVHQMSIRTTSAHTLFHARRELRLVQRTFILFTILIVLGIPYAIFVFMSFFTVPPKFHFRIAYIFADISILLIMIIIYYFTQPIKTIIKQVLTRTTAVEPIRHVVRT